MLFLRLLLIASLFTSVGHVFALLTDEGGFVDPNGGGAMDPNGVATDDGPFIDPNG
ncbi:MAG TPA: hypothetical protein VGQ36_14370 [Thermoanaerobaculia bacterium]|jgi:hypothetical protein|nr:hypothetical protein [Thermoanaerobaculia bacterium]